MIEPNDADKQRIEALTRELEESRNEVANYAVEVAGLRLQVIGRDMNIRDLQAKLAYTEGVLANYERDAAEAFERRQAAAREEV